MSSQTIYLSLTKLQDQDLVEFFEDTITYIKGGKVPFLTKYGATLGSVGQVVPLREFMIAIIQTGVRRSPTLATLETVKEGVAHYCQEQDHYMEPKLIEILAICVFARREELRKVLTELVFRQSVEKHLVDYNYNIELCLSSDKSLRVNEPILVLELFLRGSDGKDLERVVIEMGKNEAKAFVGKIREIERVKLMEQQQLQEMIGASQ